MRIHRLRLTQVKGVVEREIVFPDDGVVVVEGRNEAGKTTMIEALDLLFDEKDSSRKKHVLAMRPVGQDVPSAVEIEATSGPYRFTYRKQWFRRPATELTVTSPRREDLTGSAAHDRARAILEETTDLDLWRALRLMQATPLGASDLSGSTALADALEEAAGQALDSAGAEGDSLVQAAEEAYREFFTATGRPTGEYRDADLRVGEARRLRDEAVQAVREVADEVARHAEVVRETAQLEARSEVEERLLDELRTQWEATEEIVRESERLAVVTRMARQAFDTAAERAQARETAVAEVSDLRLAAQQAEARHASLLEESHPHEPALADALAGIDRAREDRRRARREASRAESDIALVGDLRDLASVGERIRRLDESLDRLAEARVHARVTRFDVSRASLEAAVASLELARAQWRAGSAAWEVIPEEPGLEVVVDGVSQVVDEAASGILGETVEILLPGVARLRLEPSGGVSDRGAEVRRAEAVLDDLLAAAGVPDIAAARAADTLASDARRDLTQAERDVDVVLGGESVEEVRQRGTELLAHVVELLAARGDDAGDALVPPVDLTGVGPAEVDDALVAATIDRVLGTSGGAAAADPHRSNSLGVSGDTKAATALLRAAAKTARAREDAADDDIARLEAEATTRRGALERSRVEVARAEVAAQSARAAVEDAATRLARARERATDDALDARVREARAALTEALAREQVIAAEVRRHDPESLAVRLSGAEAAATSLRRRSGEVRDERLAIEARLRHAGEQGRAERLADAESALARAERAHASLDRRARAARTLFETLTRHRAEVTQTYVEPFGRAVSRLGRVVYGSDFDVEVSPSLAIEARMLGDRRIPYDALSSGAKEQMSIITRLACASLVDPDQGAPVILDDALGYSDPGRLQRICSAFTLVGGRAQVILLTCTPGRYSAIPDAHVIRI